MTSGPDPGELLGFWGSMVFHHAPIPRKGSGNQQQQQQECNQEAKEEAIPLIETTLPRISSEAFTTKGFSKNDFVKL